MNYDTIVTLFSNFISLEQLRRRWIIYTVVCDAVKKYLGISDDEMINLRDLNLAIQLSPL